MNMQTNDIRVSEQIICYIDILGYGYLIQVLGENEFLNVINSVMREFKKITNKKLRLIQKDISYYCKVLSDNIIISCEIPDPVDMAMPSSAKPIFRLPNDVLILTSSIIEFVKYLQLELIRKYGIFIRGGITKGNLYIDKDFVFGTGLIKAYEMESKNAIYPSIIIDKNIINFSDAELSFNRMMPLIYKLSDKISFIDYLNIEPLISINYNKEIKDVISERYICECFNAHKKYIENNLLIFANNQKVKNKYEWCAKYHNVKCKQMNREEFLIY